MEKLANTKLKENLEYACLAKRQLAIKLDLEKSISDLDSEEIILLKKNLMHHGIICLPKQDIKPVELLNFTEKWGEVLALPAGLAFNNQEPNLPQIARVGNVRPDGTVIPNNTLAEYWHHDGDFWQSGENHIINFLYGVKIPTKGGRTGFLDTRKAYQELSEIEKAKLENSYIVVHSSDITDFKDAKEEEKPQNAKHPVCFPNPFTKEIALYLPESYTGINKDGQTIGFSKDYIEQIQAQQGIFQYVWEVGDLLIWDNLQVMHRSMGGYFDEARLLFRCQARLKDC
jgi:taurine dioxygenase